MEGILTSPPGGFNPDPVGWSLRAMDFPLGVCMHCHAYITFVESKQAGTHLPKANILLNDDQNSLRRFQRTSEDCRGQQTQLEGLAVVQVAPRVLQSLPATQMETATVPGTAW